MKKKLLYSLLGAIIMIGIIYFNFRAGVSAQIISNYEAEQIIIPTIEEVIANGGYPVNEYHMTYGPNIQGMDDPDLMIAEGIDGTLGYIKASDLNPNVTTIEQALSHNGQRKDAISLYMQDGCTVIGEFKLGK